MNKSKDEFSFGFGIGLVIGFCLTFIIGCFIFSATDNTVYVCKQAKLDFFNELRENGFTVKDSQGFTVKTISFESKPKLDWTHTRDDLQEYIDAQKKTNDLKFQEIMKIYKFHNQCPCQD